MSKRLTKAAHYKQAAIVKLQQDLLNGPLHCFGCHTNCSTDFCTIAQRMKNSNANNSHLESSSCTLSSSSSDSLSSNPTPSSLTSTPQSSSSDDSTIEHSSQQLADTSEDLSPEDLSTFTTEQEQQWIDATTDKYFEEVRDIPVFTDESLDLTMNVISSEPSVGW